MFRMKLSRPFEIIIGYSGNWVMCQGFDYILYPFVIYKLGILRGGIVMAFLSLTVCLLTLWFYDWAKRDWLGIEFLKELKSYEGKSRFRRVFSQLLNRTDTMAFVVLSLRYDPFITTTYLRRGRYNGLSARDWRIFFGSVMLSNAAWAVVCWGGVEAIKKVWH
jgi:hypothetical protein